MESNSNKAKANRDYRIALNKVGNSLLSSVSQSNHIHVEQPQLREAELELITKFPPSVLFCFHGRLYFERCNRCRRTTSEAKDNFARFSQKITDFS